MTRTLVLAAVAISMLAPLVTSAQAGGLDGKKYAFASGVDASERPDFQPHLGPRRCYTQRP